MEITTTDISFSFSTRAYDDTTIGTNASMISEEERQRYLDQLQDDTIIVMIPAMIFLILVGVAGLVGNSLVLFVYSQKFRQTTTRILILTIAGFDLVANIVVIPTNIYDMFHRWDFNHPHLCGVRKFVNCSTTLSSAMILLAVAIVRYRKVCIPYGWQVTKKHAKIVSVVVAFLAILFSLPFGVINGRQTQKTPRPGIHGYACGIDDSYIDTKWPMLNNVLFLLVFIAVVPSVTVLYILIGVQAWKHRKRHGAAINASTAVKKQAPGQPNAVVHYRSSTTSPENSSGTDGLRSTDGTECSSVDLGSAASVLDNLRTDDERKGDTKASACIHIKENNSVDSEDEAQNGNNAGKCTRTGHVYLEKGQDKKEKLGLDSKLRHMFSKAKYEMNTPAVSRKDKVKGTSHDMGRTTAMLVIITVICYVGYAPYMAVMFFQFMAPEKYAALNMLELSIYHLCYRLYLINSGANPIIYSLCDKNFRRECFRLLKCFSHNRN